MLVYFYGLLSYVVMSFILLTIVGIFTSIFYSAFPIEDISPNDDRELYIAIKSYKEQRLGTALSYIINVNFTYYLMMYFDKNVNPLYLFIPLLLLSLINQYSHYSSTYSLYRKGEFHGAIIGILLLCVQYIIWY
ncbi:hypothetical protein ACLSY3_04825 [Avibacterium avium]|uniref:hypothetical protein n=1 Tax=Avibacterium avium TaxID=751 RepID=UPI003BF82FF8